MVDLGLQESDQSEAVAVNDQGVIVGAYWMFGKKHYFLWEEYRGITLIDLPETAVIVVLNNASQIAGNYTDSSGTDRGFIWDQCCGFFDIGTLGGSFTRVYDMNDRGQIVGESQSSNISLVDEGKEQHAFLWQCGCMRDLGALVGDLGVLGDRSVATSINNLGQIVGTSNYLMAHKRKFLRVRNRAVVWTNNVVEELNPDLDLLYTAAATFINDVGIVTFGSDQREYFAIDLADKSKTMFSRKFSEPFSVTDSKDIFFRQEGRYIHQAYFKNNNKQYDCYSDKFNNFYVNVYFPESYENLPLWKHNSFIGSCFNKNRFVAGKSENIYGEWHAILLVPVID